jgi:hypothetical protein
MQTQQSQSEMELADRLRKMNIAAIAVLISREWPKVYFGAVPYLNAMRSLDTIGDPYGAEDGRSIVRYFLSNATTWRGPTAKAVKAELNKRLK